MLHLGDITKITAWKTYPEYKELGVFECKEAD
jgi:hypothetical protein